jgi:hypothetical protein
MFKERPLTPGVEVVPMSRACTFLVVFLFLVTGCFLVEKTEAAKPEGADPNPPADVRATLDLKVAAPVIRVGETPKISVELTNKGTAPITIVLPGDGSECGWRTPILTWTPAIKMGGRCGNINPLQSNEVVTLLPGKSVVLGAWVAAPALATPGKHKLTLTYENKPGLAWKGLALGKHDPAAMAKVKASTPLKVVSNTVEVEVQGAKAP